MPHWKISMRASTTRTLRRGARLLFLAITPNSLSILGISFASLLKFESGASLFLLPQKTNLPAAGAIENWKSVFSA
jgi:hypothetical protein